MEPSFADHHAAGVTCFAAVISAHARSTAAVGTSLDSVVTALRMSAPEITTAATRCISMSAMRVAALAPPTVAGPANDRTANAHAMTTNAVRASL